MIKELKKSQIPQLLDLWRDSARAAHPFIEAAYWDAHLAQVRDVYLPIAQTYVFLEDNRIAGFISILDRDFIGGLFVSTDRQGKGIGSRLMEFVQQRYAALDLTVYAENCRAVAFYKKHGFFIAREQTDHEVGRQEYLMTWKRGNSAQTAAD